MNQNIAIIFELTSELHRNEICQNFAATLSKYHWEGIFHGMQTVFSLAFLICCKCGTFTVIIIIIINIIDITDRIHICILN